MNRWSQTHPVCLFPRQISLTAQDTEPILREIMSIYSFMIYICVFMCVCVMMNDGFIYIYIVSSSPSSVCSWRSGTAGRCSWRRSGDSTRMSGLFEPLELHWRIISVFTRTHLTRETHTHTWYHLIIRYNNILHSYNSSRINECLLSTHHEQENAE